MSIFNSLGSNYNLRSVLDNLLAGNDEEYSQRLKRYLGDMYGGQVTLTYKGREAIELALNILDLPTDSYIAVTGYTCYAVYIAVKNAGCHIEYLDIDKKGINFSAETLSLAINRNPKIKAVIVQNTLGYPCDIRNIESLCQRQNIILIEDLAHSVGALYEDGREAGTVGQFVALSFSQDKIIDSVSGGALIVRDRTYQDIHPRIFGRVNVQQQRTDKFYPLLTFVIRGTYTFRLGKLLHHVCRRLKLLSSPMSGLDGQYLYRLPNRYARIVYKQFSLLDGELKHRRAIARIYSKNLSSELISAGVSASIEGATNLRFPICVNNRDEIVHYLRGQGIHLSDIWYDAPVAPKKYMQAVDFKQDSCPNAVEMSRVMVNLPTHKNISVWQAKLIAGIVNKWLTLQQER